MFQKTGRKLVLIFTIIVICSLFQGIALAQDKDSYKVLIDGKLMTIPEGYGSVFFDSNGRTQIPLRALTEAMGYSVLWDGNTQTVSIPLSEKDNSIKVSLQLNSKILHTPNGDITMDTVAFTKDGRTYIPLRFICEALGYKVSYRKELDNSSIGTNTTHIFTVDRDSGVNRYKSKNGVVSMTQIGSMENSSIKRIANSTLKQDIETLRKILVGTSFTLSNTGSFQSDDGYNDRSDPMSGFVIGKTDLKLNVDGHIIFTGSKYTAIKITDWGLTKNEESFADTKVLENFGIEVFKYYSQNYDGELLWKFLDDKIKARQDIDISKTYTFGSTKVKFYETPTEAFGIYVIFLN